MKPFFAFEIEMLLTILVSPPRGGHLSSFSMRLDFFSFNKASFI